MLIDAERNNIDIIDRTDNEAGTYDNFTSNIKEKLQSKSVMKELTGHKKRVYTLDWNMNGSKLASGSVDCSIKVRPN